MSRRPEQRSFTVWIEPRPGAAIAEQTSFARRLEDYGEARDLLIGGGPLCAVVFAEHRSLSAIDQVDLIDWLIDDPIVRSVAVSPLSTAIDRPASRADGYLRVQATGLTLIGATLLYRNRALSAELYLQLLGGFVRPLTLH
jgi:hypothetical protein